MDWAGFFRVVMRKQLQVAQPYRHPRERASSLEPCVDDSSSPESLERDVNALDPGDERSCSFILVLRHEDVCHAFFLVMLARSHYLKVCLEVCLWVHHRSPISCEVFAAHLILQICKLNQ